MESKEEKLKILIVGDINGDVANLFDFVENIQSKKGLFDVLFCVGNFLPQLN